MGHKGEISALYSVNKGVSQADIDRMRKEYLDASKFLVTNYAKKDVVTKEQLSKAVFENFSDMAGYSPEERAKIDASNLTPEQNTLQS